MTSRSPTLALIQIVDGLDKLQTLVVGPSSLDELEADWVKRSATERQVEIVSEASRRLSPEWKLRFAAVPWQKIADIGNVLRHGYDTVSLPVIVGLKVEGHLDQLRSAVETLLTEQEPKWRDLRTERRARAAAGEPPLP